MADRQFPLILPRGLSGRTSIPWKMIESHEPQAWLNHGQSLERLANRGGLCNHEALAVLEDRRWAYLPSAEAEARLAELVYAFEQAHPNTPDAEPS